MPLLNRQYYTATDIYALPEGKRVKLIEGEIFDMASPSRKHQEVVAFFTKTIGNYIGKNKGNCKVYPAPSAVFLKTDGNSEDYENYVEPDISIICDPSKLNDKSCKGAPDWIVETVSPSSRSMDYYLKLSLCQMNGVRGHWIVDAERKIAIAYGFENLLSAALYRFDSTIKTHVFRDLGISFSSIVLN